jgi:phosphinothricin acetyltransferase
MMIEVLTAGHWQAVRQIYAEGIATGNATFQTVAPEWDEWDAGHLPVCRIMARTEAGVVGWAALSPVSRRTVYSGVAEVSVYVAAQSRRKGTGHALLASLITKSERHGFWTLQAGIFPENAASLFLHLKHGFRVVGTREKIGCMNGIWRDVVLLERRSSAAGV